MNERTTVRLPRELLDLAKRKARAENRTLTSLIEEGLRWAVVSQPKTKRTERALPRISAARGGLMPGIDLTDRSKLEDVDDLDYARRAINRT